MQSLLVDVLGISSRRAGRLATSGTGWNAAGVHPPSVRERIHGVPGIYAERTFQRYYPHGDLARGVLGVIIDDEGRGGIEGEFESWL
ncbi:MAG: hypothetical protein GWO00_06575, partial [Gemmatimonadetes bacterium]|nr:hypothetical protein [Actinomycetota bacterium]NIR78044.1 hypothetical protein [Gemmatimonadota bacterium]NIT86605.1 hypothetical protein [Gemmatimonadota bacterium]NIU30450.1 hypothetical protein [Gemmatimonadota bacterium]NIV60832.1 hypothetical protein [Gemmatimonadota bacterium]